jgi:hypothetical protein
MPLGAAAAAADVAGLEDDKVEEEEDDDDEEEAAAPCGAGARLCVILAPPVDASAPASRGLFPLPPTPTPPAPPTPSPWCCSHSMRVRGGRDAMSAAHTVHMPLYTTLWMQ